MKYTLIIGIEFKKFKRPATLTVHIGNTFVDTFDLEQDYPPKKTTIAFTDTEKNELYESSKWGGSSWILDDLSDREIDIPTFYKMYEIDEECVEGTLKIRVENSNSDYTNGFMKNSSLVKFPIVSIVPSSFFEDHGKKLMEITTRLKRVEAKYCNRLELKKTPLWVKNSPEALQEKTPWSTDRINQNDFYYPKEHKWTHHFCRHYWPLAGLFLVRRDNEKHEKDAVRHCKWKIGGNFTAEFPIRQKHKTKYIGSWARREIGLLFSPNMGLFYVGKTLINIYNEDKRSNRT
jgi:hypothetical protein